MPSYWFINYRGCILYHDDIELLKGGNWFNDAIILFAMNRILDILYQDYPIEIVSSILFMDPTVISYINLQCASDEEKRQCGLDNDINNNKKYMLIPINNNTSFNSTSSHWSLLLIHISTFTCIHFDSIHQSNYHSAISTAQSISVVLGLPTNTGFKVLKALTPQQVNSYDCGVYAVYIAEILSEYVLKTLSKNAAFKEKDEQKNEDICIEIRECESLLANIVTPESITKYRRIILDAANSLEKIEMKV